MINPFKAVSRKVAGYFLRDSLEYRPLCKGAAGILEREIHKRHVLYGRGVYALEVPSFLYDKFIEELTQFGHAEACLMGVYISASKYNEMRFIELIDIQNKQQFDSLERELTSIMVRSIQSEVLPRTEEQRRRSEVLKLSLENYELLLRLGRK